MSHQWRCSCSCNHHACSRFFPNFSKNPTAIFQKNPLKFSKLKNQGPFILNEAMPDLMVAFLGWNSNFEKKVRGAYS